MVKDFKKRFFSESECEEIEKTIAEIEKNTSGEILVVLSPTSDSYFRARLLGAFIGWFIASAIALIIEWNSHWGAPFEKLLALQALGILAGGVLAYVPLMARLLVPSAILGRNVHREALAQFAALGLHATKEHTGILVMLSIFERRVEIVADKGIHSKVDDTYWKKQAELISSGFKEKKPASHLIDSLRQMGAKLAEHFPPNPNDTNEISNKVHFLG